jgi:hypothetical protein
VGLSVRFPRHSVWPILPGVRSFLNCEKGLGNNSGAWRVSLPLRECQGRGLGCGGLQ